MVCAVVLACLGLQAQQISIPYFCGFEDETDAAGWVLNSGTPFAGDQWIMGTATHSENKHSLYITTDNGRTASYGSRPNTVTAYKVMKLPILVDTVSIQHYELSFDWKSIGEKDISELYVFFDTEQNLSQLATSETSGMVLTAQALNAMQPVSKNGGKALYGQPGWHNVSIPINVNNKVAQRFNFVLAFVWVNRNTSEEVAESQVLGACIDNLQICSARAPKPTDFKVELNCAENSNGLTISWRSVLDEFMLEFKDINANRWSVINGLNASEMRDPKDATIFSYTIDQMKESSYDFRVRGVIGNDTSAYAYYRDFRLFCWDNQCINYIDFDGPNTVCTYGTYNNPYESFGYLDFGTDAMESRHTVNWEHGVYDERTVGANGKGLLKVPDDALATVRLGNWKAGAEAESVSYTFTVDSTDQAILLVRYAIVFEDPQHPDMTDEFRLEILDEYGFLVDPTCGRALFTYKEEDVSEWNDWEYGNQKGKWKDWTTIGLNLSEFHGQDITVRLTTLDCGQSGHFGYAYYMMSCASAKLLTDACGEMSDIEVVAPEGFSYAWYNASGDKVSTEKTIEVPKGDTQRYTCDVCFKESPDCCFQLSTALNPRYPFAQMDYRREPARCRNTVRLVNNSHVIYLNGTDTLHQRLEQCDSYLWEVRSLKNPRTAPLVVSLPNPTYNCDINGDLLEVKLTAFLANEECSDYVIDTIMIPGIVTFDQTITKEFCEGGNTYFAGEFRTETGLYVDSYKNIAGCDSLIYLDLTVHPKSPETYLVDTICSDGSYRVAMQSFNKTGNYEIWLRNTWGCDSIINLDLTVTEKLQVEVDSIPSICADDGVLTIDFRSLAGQYDSIAVRFSEEAHQQGLIDMMIFDQTLSSISVNYLSSVMPGNYSAELEFYQHKSCGNQVFDLPFAINFASSAIVQRWNDVLGLQNDRYNGGFVFSTYQWYKNGVAIDGATNYYLYVSDGLDMNAEYSVVVTTADGKRMSVCPYTPVNMSGVQNIPTLLFGGQQVSRRDSGVATWTDVVGNVLHSQNYDKAIDVPALQEGYYVLHLDENGRQIVKKVLIKQ